MDISNCKWLIDNDKKKLQTLMHCKGTKNPIAVCYSLALVLANSIVYIAKKLILHILKFISKDSF